MACVRWPKSAVGLTCNAALRKRCLIFKSWACASFGDWQKDVNSIAVPVRPGSGLPHMAISCGAPTYVVSQEFLLSEVRPRLIAMAANLEKALGTAV
jgi:DNA-binding IclR family transcriptional regulator